MKPSFSLKQSTFSTLVVASALLLLVFTHLQLTREADNTAKRQISETQLSLLLAKTILESTLKSVETPFVATESRNKDRLVLALTDLTKKVPALKDAVLLSKTGHLIFPPGSPNSNASTDQNRIQEILLTPDWNGEWFRTLPSASQRDSLDIYTPLFSSNGIEYILKTTVSLDTLKTAFLRTYGVIILIFGVIVCFAIFLAYQMSRKVLAPIKLLLKSTEEISKGNLNHEVVIKTGDEIEELSDAFNQMARKLSNMKNVAEDANALTHLPGNNVISDVINGRLKTGAKIAVMHTDLDRFKIYNDSYGIQRGDEVIGTTAEILKEAVALKGTPSDLVAHEGGDDFVVVSTPTHIDAIAKEIIRIFDSRIGFHYRAEDRDRRHILIKDRRSKDADAPKVEIPLMSISLAAVTNEQNSFSSYPEIATALVAMKKKAKGIQGSSFAISR